MTDRIMTNGVLRKSLKNPRYFEDGKGKVVLLTGSHTWASLQELRIEGDPLFDYEQYLNMMSGHKHNFMRMWQWGHPLMAPWTLDKVYIEPLPYKRSGMAAANDGLPQFNLDDWNDLYFERLRDRVIRAGDRGIYVSLMFFDGWCPKNARPDSDPWFAHPYNGANNMNGVYGYTNNKGRADIYNLENPQVLAYQKAFISKCIDTLNDLDHVLFEIINEVENTERGLKWHAHMVDYVKQYEASQPKQHPVGMTAVGGEQFNPILFEHQADWISPGNGPQDEYKHNPPEADGSKVIISDTDHLWGHGGNYHWAWKSFLRGLNPIFMDPWCPVPGATLPEYPGDNRGNSRDFPNWEPLRINLGYIRDYAERIGLETMLPAKNTTSTGFCLAKPGQQYLIYGTPEDKGIDVDLRVTSAKFSCEWFNPTNGETIRGEDIAGGGVVFVQALFADGAVLYLKKIEFLLPASS